eukprot:gb/GECH01008529.1/.p1 GENE.gb/GECH01008529.1/~~gb/GECH01008529.1/.p1  ORF type:complete len:600 (+),score=152.67 gb/GECH01008529.1/:1-1800(+)
MKLMKPVIVFYISLLFLSTFAIVDIVLGSPIQHNHEDRQFIEFSEPQPIPEGWEQHHLSEHDFHQSSVSLIFALKQRSVEKLENIFHSVSDPKSEKYGEHLTWEQIRSLVAPHSQHIELVQSFLERYGIPRSHHRFASTLDFLTVDHVSIAHAQEILGVQLHEFQHLKTGASFIKTREPYTLPSSIADVVDFVGGPIRFPSTQLLLASNPDSRTQFHHQHDQQHRHRHRRVNASDMISPAKIRHQYNVGNATGKSPKNSQAVASFLKQYYSPQDLSKFLERNGITPRHVDRVVGPNDASNPGVEASLDIQFIMGIGTHIRTWFVSTPGTHDQQEPFLQWIMAMQYDTSPWVHSVSYGDIEHSISPVYAQRLNTEFMKFGAVGHTILVASGDNGARCTDGCTRFVPEWPTSSPYVTSVGGTELTSSDDSPSSSSLRPRSRSPEASVYFSGGGFSNYYPMPSYQKNVVASYLSSSSCPSHSFFNTSGRAYPDVAALATNYGVVFRGVSIPVDGTSCSTPTMAALVSLLNDARLEAGKRPLGFLNPLFYQLLENHPHVFTDIVDGNNSNGCCPGFKATQGWDAISGCGTLNFENMLQVITQK